MLGEEKFNPEGAEAQEVSAFLGKPLSPTEEDHQTRVRKEARGKLMQLLAFAETQPMSWKLLIQFIGEEVQRLSYRAVAVNPADDPVKSHGMKCFQAGGAEALTELAHHLLPETLRKRIDKLDKLCNNVEQ